MTRTTIECPQCSERLAVRQSAWGKTVPCPACRWPIAVPHPDHRPTPPAVLDRQGDILAAYHERLVGLYERTTVAIEEFRSRRSAEQIESERLIEEDTRRVACLVEIAKTELQVILDSAERAARRARREAAAEPRKKLRKHFPNHLRCPHCGKKVRYKTRGAGQHQNCPNPECGRPVFLPSTSESFWQAIDRNK